MIIKTDLTEGVHENITLIHAQRSERQDGTYEIITKDEYGRWSDMGKVHRGTLGQLQ